MSSGKRGNMACTAPVRKTYRSTTLYQMQVEGRSQTASVRLLPSHELVSVRLKELGEKEDEADAGRKSHKRNRNIEAEPPFMVAQHVPKDREAGLAEDRSADIHAPNTATQDSDRDAREERPWLAANIRVKVIDKKMGGGK